MDIGVIEAPTVRQLFVDKMAGMILDGKLKAGEKLPSERELAAQAHISKSAVHIAMSELEHLGLIKTNARMGTYVCDLSREGSIETLKVMLNARPDRFLDRKHMQDMMEMRTAIEGKALERLCEKLNAEDEALLSQDIEAAKAVVRNNEGAEALAKCLFRFHHDICYASGNFILPLLFNSFEFVTVPYWEKAIQIFGSCKCISLMESLFALIQKKDSDAAKAYLRHEFKTFLKESEGG